jgi:hypothetical protein
MELIALIIVNLGLIKCFLADADIFKLTFLINTRESASCSINSLYGKDCVDFSPVST